MEETDEIKGLRERLVKHDARSDDLARTIESDSWEHLRATTDMEQSSLEPTAQHDVPEELLEASVPTQELHAVVPRPDDERWVLTHARVRPDGSLELPEEIAKKLRAGDRIPLQIFADD